MLWHRLKRPNLPWAAPSHRTADDSTPLLLRPVVARLASMAGGGGVVGGLAKLRDLLSWVRRRRRRGRKRGRSKSMWKGHHGQEQQHFQEGSRYQPKLNKVKFDYLDILKFHKHLPPAGSTYPCLHNPPPNCSSRLSNVGEAPQVWARRPSGAQPLTSLTMTRRGPLTSQVAWLGAPSSHLLRSASELEFERKPERSWQSSSAEG